MKKFVGLLIALFALTWGWASAQVVLSYCNDCGQHHYSTECPSPHPLSGGPIPGDLFPGQGIPLPGQILPELIPAAPSQPVELKTTDKKLQSDDYLQDRRGAAARAGQFATNERVHQIRLSADGTAAGKIWIPSAPIRPGSEVPAGGLDVVFLKDHVAVQSGRTDSDGTFKISGLSEGTHSLVAFGEGGLLAFSVHLTQSATGGIEEFNSLAVPPTDIPLAVNLMQRQIGQVETSTSDAGSDDTAVPPGQVPVAQLGSGGTTLAKHFVYLNEAGELNGAIRRLQSESGRFVKSPAVEIYLIRDGAARYESVRTNADGLFTIPGVAPGVYSFVAIGGRSANDPGIGEGFLAFSVGVLQRDQATQPVGTESVEQVFFDDASEFLEIDATLIDLRDAQILADLAGYNNVGGPVGGQAGGPMGGVPFGGPGGGGFGGGGGGAAGGGGGAAGGGGGLGALLAGAAGAAIGYAISEQDNDTIISPPGP